MLESLEEGIVLLRANEISFSNTIFDEILGKSENNQLEQSILMEKKVFKIYRKDNEQENGSPREV